MRGTNETPKGNPRSLGRGGGQQKLLAEVAKRASGESRDILSLLSLMNPEKLMHIIG